MSLKININVDNMPLAYIIKESILKLLLLYKNIHEWTVYKNIYFLLAKNSYLKHKI